MSNTSGGRQLGLVGLVGESGDGQERTGDVASVEDLVVLGDGFDLLQFEVLSGNGYSGRGQTYLVRSSLFDSASFWAL